MKISHAYIEITNSCNLNCRSCYNRSGMKHLRQELYYIDFSKISNRLIGELDCKRISLSGGEPTLNRDFAEILDKSLSLNTSIAVVTNGTTDCEKLINTYNSNNIAIQISLDGSCEEINSFTRGEGNFTKTVGFIETLDKKIPPVIKMVVSKFNIDNVADFFEFAIDHDCLPEFDFVAPIGNAADSWEAIGLNAREKLNILRTIDALNFKHNVSAKLPYCTSACPLSDPEAELSVLIKPNGDIYPCQMLYGEKFKLGNILTDTKEMITERMAEITAIAAKREQTDFGCTRCLARQFCKRGCMAFADMRSGDPLANDGDCEYRKFQLVGFSAIKQEVI